MGTRATVTIPITGLVRIECEVSDPSDISSSIDEALAAWDSMGEKEQRDAVELEFTDHVTDGNVSHAMLNDADVEPITRDDEQEEEEEECQPRRCGDCAQFPKDESVFGCDVADTAVSKHHGCCKHWEPRQ